MNTKWLNIGGWALIFAERAWKHSEVMRYFRRPTPVASADRPLVSILQPVLSGDPTMAASLERTLAMRTGYPLEVIWLADHHDHEAQSICRALAARYPHQTTRLILVDSPGPRENPKLVKLIAGVSVAAGSIFCVLDDDTRLPDDGLDLAIPYLDEPGVGLAFGLPYYEHFSNLWSSLVSLFVNGNSLLTYLPYLRFSQPFTINGMFYVLKREVYERIGGFEPIKSIAADDFAVGSAVRQHGYRLAQTPVRHGISTTVTSFDQYRSLMGRWLIVPRESVLRQLSHKEVAITIGLGLFPALVPLVLLARLMLWPSQHGFALTAAYFAYCTGMTAHFNRAYLRDAIPCHALWLSPVTQVVTVLQVVTAILSPQRIIWRGKVMRVERGGTFTYEQASLSASAGAPAPDA